MQLTTMQEVLIVEDRQLHRLLATELCSQLGFSSIRHTANGEEGMAQVRQQVPDLMLLDLEMPRGAGRLEKPLQAGSLKDLLARLSLQSAHAKESCTLCNAAEVRLALEQQQIIPY